MGFKWSEVQILSPRPGTAGGVGYVPPLPFCGSTMSVAVRFRCPVGRLQDVAAGHADHGRLEPVGPSLAAPHERAPGAGRRPGAAPLHFSPPHGRPRRPTCSAHHDAPARFRSRFAAGSSASIRPPTCRAGRRCGRMCVRSWTRAGRSARVAQHRDEPDPDRAPSPPPLVVPAGHRVAESDVRAAASSAARPGCRHSRRWTASCWSIRSCGSPISAGSPAISTAASATWRTCAAGI